MSGEKNSYLEPVILSGGADCGNGSFSTGPVVLSRTSPVDLVERWFGDLGLDDQEFLIELGERDARLLREIIDLKVDCFGDLSIKILLKCRSLIEKTVPENLYPEIVFLAGLIKGLRQKKEKPRAALEAMKVFLNELGEVEDLRRDFVEKVTLVYDKD